MRRYQAGLAGIKGENHDVHPGAQEAAPLTVSLAAAVTVFTVTACGMGHRSLSRAKTRSWALTWRVALATPLFGIR
jgi:hypothetical protein